MNVGPGADVAVPEGRPTDAIVAGVLVGGQSRRFNGNKLVLPLANGQTLMEHVVSVARPVACEVVLLGTPQALPASLAALKVLPDDPMGSGPAAGLATLLKYASTRWVLLLSSDLPKLTVSLLQTLLHEPRDGVDAIAFVRDGNDDRREPCCALYHPDVLPIVEEELAFGKGRLQTVLQRIRLRTIKLEGPACWLLADVDTREDAADLLGDVSSTSQA